MASLTLAQPRYVEQRQDNYDATNTKTWQQAYYVNDTFWSPGSDAPVFLCVGACRASAHNRRSPLAGLLGTRRFRATNAAGGQSPHPHPPHPPNSAAPAPAAPRRASRLCTPLTKCLMFRVLLALLVLLVLRVVLLVLLVLLVRRLRRARRLPVCPAGGEGPPLTGASVVASPHCNIAVEHLAATKGIMFAVEHRYYGCHNMSACPVPSFGTGASSLK